MLLHIVLVHISLACKTLKLNVICITLKKIARLLQYLPYAQSHIVPYSYLVYRIYILTDTAEEVSHFTINI